MRFRVGALAFAISESIPYSDELYFLSAILVRPGETLQTNVAQRKLMEKMNEVLSES